MAQLRRVAGKGNTCLKMELYDEAVVYFKRCLSIQSPCPQATFNMAVARLRQGKLEEGLDLAAEAVALDDDLGVRLGASGDVEEVRRKLKERFESSPEMAAVIDHCDAKEFPDLQTGEDEEVPLDEDGEPDLDTFFSSDASEGREAEAQAKDAYTEGVSRIRKKDFDGAKAAFKRSIDLEPASPQPYNDLAAVHMMNGDWDEAIPLLEKATKLKVDYFDAFLNLGVANMKKGDFRGAMVAYRSAALVRPASAKAAHQVGVCNERIGDADQAIEWHRKAIEADNKFVDAHYHLGCMLLKKRDDFEAEACFVKVIELNPKHFKALSNLGSVRMRRGEVEDAAKAFERAVEAMPKYAAARVNLALAYANIGNHEGAVEHLKAAEEIDPKLVTPKTLALVGDACLEVGERDKAIELLERAVDKEPDLETAQAKLAEAYYDKAIDLFGLKEHAEGVEYAEKALKIDPQNPLFHMKLGMGHMYLKDYREAAEHLEKVVELVPDGTDTTLRYNLACCYSLLGEVDAGCKWIGKAVDLGYDDWLEVQDDDDLHPLQRAAGWDRLIERMKAGGGPEDGAKSDDDAPKKADDDDAIGEAPVRHETDELQIDEIVVSGELGDDDGPGELP